MSLKYREPSTDGYRDWELNQEIGKLHQFKTIKSLNMKTKVLIVSLLLAIFGISCKPKSPVRPATPEAVVQAPEYKKMITARVYIKAGKEAEFIEAAKSIIEASNKEEGCTGYMLYQEPYEKTNFIFVETYKNQAAVDYHFSTTYFKEFGTKIADMVSKPAEIKVFDIAGEK
jgi:quinol monooxygenase YgiN